MWVFINWLFSTWGTELPRVCDAVESKIMRVEQSFSLNYVHGRNKCVCPKRRTRTLSLHTCSHVIRHGKQADHSKTVLGHFQSGLSTCRTVIKAVIVLYWLENTLRLPVLFRHRLTLLLSAWISHLTTTTFRCSHWFNMIVISGIFTGKCELLIATNIQSHSFD
jgi:hypothetical protein